MLPHLPHLWLRYHLKTKAIPFPGFHISSRIYCPMLLESHYKLYREVPDNLQPSCLYKYLQFYFLYLNQLLPLKNIPQNFHNSYNQKIFLGKPLYSFLTSHHYPINKFETIYLLAHLVLEFPSIPQLDLFSQAQVLKP